MKTILGLGFIAVVGALVSCSTTTNTNMHSANANNAYIVNATPPARTPDPGVTPPVYTNSDRNANTAIHMNSNANANRKMNSNVNHD